MGEIADDMLCGLMCDQCGCYFTEEHGYPVNCKECWYEITPSERNNHQRATHDTI